MKLLTWKSFLSICLMVLSKAELTRADDANVFSYLREKYDELPDKGKFATGAVVGFGASRVAVKSAVTVVKVAGAAYIASEVLNAAGLLDELPRLSEANTEILEGVKLRALQYADEFRTTVRQRLNPDKIKSLMETDRMATMGAAAGGVLGFLL